MTRSTYNLGRDECKTCASTDNSPWFRQARSFADGERAMCPMVASHYPQRQRLEWILRIKSKRDAPQLFSYPVDVAVDVQRHRLKIAIATLEVGTLA
jgi:hypothetical protein